MKKSIGVKALFSFFILLIFTLILIITGVRAANIANFTNVSTINVSLDPNGSTSNGSNWSNWSNWSNFSIDPNGSTSNGSNFSNKTNEDFKINLEFRHGILPSSPFYFVERFADTFRGPETIANRKIAEFIVMSERGNVDAAETSLGIYNGVIDRLEQRSAQREDIAERVAKSTSMHLIALVGVYERSPEQARPTIEEAMISTVQGRERAILSLGNRDLERSILVREETMVKIIEETGSTSREEIERAFERAEGVWTRAEYHRGLLRRINPEDGSSGELNLDEEEKEELRRLEVKLKMGNRYENFTRITEKEDGKIIVDVCRDVRGEIINSWDKLTEDTANNCAGHLGSCSCGISCETVVIGSDLYIWSRCINLGIFSSWEKYVQEITPISREEITDEGYCHIGKCEYGIPNCRTFNKDGETIALSLCNKENSAKDFFKV